MIGKVRVELAGVVNRGKAEDLRDEIYLEKRLKAKKFRLDGDGSLVMKQTRTQEVLEPVYIKF